MREWIKDVIKLAILIGLTSAIYMIFSNAIDYFFLTH